MEKGILWIVIPELTLSAAVERSGCMATMFDLVISHDEMEIVFKHCTHAVTMKESDWAIIALPKGCNCYQQITKLENNPRAAFIDLETLLKDEEKGFEHLISSIANLRLLFGKK